MKYEIVDDEFRLQVLEEVLSSFCAEIESQPDRFKFIKDCILNNKPYIKKDSEMNDYIWDQLSKPEKIGFTSLQDEVASNYKVYAFFDDNYYYNSSCPVTFNETIVTNKVLRIAGSEIRNHFDDFPEDCYFVNESIDTLWVITHEYSSKKNSRFCLKKQSNQPLKTDTGRAGSYDTRSDETCAV